MTLGQRFCWMRQRNTSDKGLVWNTRCNTVLKKTKVGLWVGGELWVHDVLHHVSLRILVPQPGIKPVPSAIEAQSLNYWTAREAPG